MNYLDAQPLKFVNYLRGSAAATEPASTLQADVTSGANPQAQLRDPEPRFTKTFLSNLVKPVLFPTDADMKEKMILDDEDIRDLYKEIYETTRYKQHIIPHAVFEELRSMSEAAPFYPENAIEEEQYLHDDNRRAFSVQTHKDLVRVVRRSRGMRYDNDDNWHYFVYQSLLEQVFQDPNYAGSKKNPATTVQWQYVREAKIATDAVPHLKIGSTPEATSDYHARTQSKNADYVMVLNTDPNNKKLQRAIRASSSKKDASEKPWVNQTMQANLLSDMIGVSICIRVDSKQTDPAHNLGLWTAAWHHRMAELREHRFPAPVDKMAVETLLSNEPNKAPAKAPQPRMISLPVIAVEQQDWSIYYAMDTGDSIMMCGPYKLGSTATSLEAYVLLKNLRLLKAWVAKEFAQAMADWFLKDNESIAKDRKKVKEARFSRERRAERKAAAKQAYEEEMSEDGKWWSEDWVDSEKTDSPWEEEADGDGSEESEESEETLECVTPQ